MSEQTSIRQRIIDDMVTTLVSSGIVDDATDAELPTHNADRFGWVFEGDEDEDHTQIHGRLVTTLEVFVHSTFAFDGDNPHEAAFRIGRQELAKHQVAFMQDTSRGGWAFNTLPAGNSIGVAEPEPTRRGVVESRWRVVYRRLLTDPYSKG